MRRILLLLLLLGAVGAAAQVTNPSIIPVASTPTACNTLPLQIVSNTATLYGTNGSGGCTAIGGGGGAVSSVSNSDGTLTISPTTGSVVASIALGQANTWTNTITDSLSPAVSTYALLLSGTPQNGGSSTTNFPLFCECNSGAAAVTSWASGGTGIGISAPTGSTMDVLNFLINNSTKVRITGGGIFEGAQFQNVSGNDTLSFQTAGTINTVSTAGSVSMTINNSAASPTANLVNFQANSVTVGGVAKDGGAVHPAYNQNAASNTAGTCTMTTTTCTVTLGHTYTTPVCVASQQSTGTVIAGECSVTGTTATVTAASSNTNSWGVWVFGNPN